MLFSKEYDIMLFDMLQADKKVRSKILEFLDGCPGEFLKRIREVIKINEENLDKKDRTLEGIIHSMENDYYYIFKLNKWDKSLILTRYRIVDDREYDKLDLLLNYEGEWIGTLIIDNKIKTEYMRKVTSLGDIVNYRRGDIDEDRYNISRRRIVLDKDIKLIYKKIKPVVYGDGVSSINTLLRRFNSYYFKDKNISEEVLDKDMEYVYDWHFNLSKGSIASMDIDKVLRKRLEDIARETASKMGIVFASIDIIEENNGELRVLEANSGVTIDKAINFIDNGYEVAKNIYKDATKMMFNI